MGDVADSSVVCGKGREGGYWVLGLITEHPSLPRKGDQAMGARRPRRRYNRNVELVTGHRGDCGSCGPPGVAYRLTG